jgi:hypothetical protein
MLKMFRVIAFGSIAVLTACAKSSEEVSTSYVSPIQYANHDCNQLRGELGRVNRQLVQKMRSQDSRADNDAVATGVGMVLFWPALFFIKGDDEHAGELARLKGEFDAVEQAAIEKRCNLANDMARARDQQKSYIDERNKRNQINE